MMRSTWRVLAFGALVGAVALPASAQVVVGGSGAPSVEVNWAVLDQLGRQPTLADMLKSEPPAVETRPAGNQPDKAKGVQYRPYKAGAPPHATPPKPVKPTRAEAPAPAKKPSVVPASAKVAPAPAKPAAAPVHVAETKPAPSKPVETKPVESKPVETKPVEAAPAKPQMAATAELPKPVTPAVIGPQIALPEVPKPAAEPAPAPVAKSEPAAAPLPPAALTPPPLKPEPAVAKVEPAPVPAPAPQLASLTPPPPAPVPAAAPAPAVSSRGDVLTVPFAGESSSLSESSLADLDRLVKRMKKDEGLSLQLMAYAEGDDANASKARRTSLSRALEVRKYLMEQGLRATRIEVRALGNKVEGGGPADRVDAVLVSR